MYGHINEKPVHIFDGIQFKADSTAGQIQCQGNPVLGSKLLVPIMTSIDDKNTTLRTIGKVAYCNARHANL
tara:strand:- start:109 stop:321 length:213 start_codon:yes stop_codon:yes gene_type:complete